MDHDVVVIGGGAAGLAAAVALLRSRRSVLVVDAGEPRNAPADGVHNYLTREGTPPGEILALGREEVRQYGGRLVQARATSASRADGGFVVTLDDCRVVTARKLVVTTGLVDELPDVPGLAERWGHDVLHCPYCHGWEVRDQRIGVLVSNANAVHQALLFSQLTDDVTVLTHGTVLEDAQLDLLRRAGTRVVDGTVAEVLAGQRLSGVRLEDGRVVDLDALVVAPRMVARSEVLTGLGVDAVEHPSGMGVHVPADEMGQTTVPGVYVAGNVTDPSAQVIASAAQGMRVGAMVNAHLVMESLQDEKVGA